MKIRAIAAGIGLALLAAGCTAQSTDPNAESAPPEPVVFPALVTARLDDETASALDAALDSFVDNGMPAVLAAVITPDGRWTGAAGIDGPADRAATPEDEFSIASITKVFTAALVMRLVEDGDMKLDEPLSSYLGDDIDSNGATVLEALQMLSGIPDTPDSSIAKVTADPSRVWTQPEVIAEFPEPTAEPGAEYIYSNPAYKMLGYAVESVTGQSLHDAVRTLLLDPAGSPQTLLVQDATNATPQPWALPVEGSNAPLENFGVGSALPNISDATFSTAGTGMAGTAGDVADWAWQLFAGEVISSASLSQMMTTTDDDGSGSGLDELSGLGLPGAYGHTGSKDGYQSLLAVFPDDQTVIVLFVTKRDAAVASAITSLKEILAS
jgi:D-alanyl-D-alanine carboxypeptidase